MQELFPEIRRTSPFRDTLQVEIPTHMTKPQLKDLAVVSAVREGVLSPALQFYPTEEQRRVKARFWLAFRNNPVVEESAVTPAMVEQMTGTSIQSWLSNAAFWAWFAQSSDTTRDHLEVAAERAGELAMHYLDPSVEFNDNARVTLIKIVLEYSGRSPPTRKEIKWHDKEIESLSPDQLDALIDKLSKKLPAKT